MISPLLHPPLPSNTNALGSPYLRLSDAMRQLEAVAGAENVGTYGGAYMFEQSSNALYLIAQMLHGVTASSSPSVVTVCETGFEIGHSALAFLHASPSTRVVSFDMMDTQYKLDCAAWLQQTYGKERVQVVAGNTADSVPQYLRDNPQLQCGVVFPDEGHDWRDEVRTAKLFHPHATCQTIIVLDWGSDVSVMSGGVVNAERDQRWRLLEEEGIIREIGCFSGRKTFSSDHRWWNRLNTQIQFCVGRYRSINGKQCEDI
jgi:predicted O-methyltransferase YrrM